MGCTQSNEGDTRLQTVDDSVHVMLAHDKKMQQRKGQQPHGYVPRAEHPLLKPKTEGGGGGEEGPAAAPASSSGAPAVGTDQGTTTTNGSGSGQ